MDCPYCDLDTAVFAVPTSLRAYAPAEAETAALCPHCLRVRAVEAAVAEDRPFDAVGPFFPEGEGGVATALLVGQLDSLALNRRAIVALADHAERAGVDLFLVLSRLAVSTPDAHLDLDRRLLQLEQVLD